MGSFILALAPALAAAQAPAAGPEFQITTFTTYDQTLPRVAMAAGGDYVVAWNSNGQDGDGVGVYERFQPTFGVATETQVDTATLSNQWIPSAAMDGSGNFVVAWGESVGSGPTASYTIRVRRYDNSGTPLDLPLTITSGVGSGGAPRVSAYANGAFVVVWSGNYLEADDGSFGQLFDSAGNPRFGIFEVNTYTSGLQAYPDVAVQASGNFVVVWDSFPQDGSLSGIFGQQFDETGGPIGSEFPVNAYTTSTQFMPSIAADSSGNFVVAWASQGQDGSGYGIFAQRFNSFANRIGPEFRVNTFTTADQVAPSVAVDASGAFLVVWGGPSPALAGWSVLGQRFNSRGARVGSEFVVSTNTSHSELQPSVALDANGTAIVTWAPDYATGSGTDIVARRLYLDAAHPMAVDAHGVFGTSSNVNGVLETGETVQIEPAWKKLTLVAFTGAASNLTGPAGPTYTLADAGANYFSLAPAGTLVDCFHTTGDCYLVGVSGARPAAHWDATFDEALDNGLTKTWTLHVGESFPDVPTTQSFYGFIENIFHNGITSGCGGGSYCPSASVTRAQMAVFLLKSEHDSSYTPPGCTGLFPDVPCPGPFTDWIEQLAAEGITGGCGGGNYCPSNPVTRAQMAVFLLKAEHGSGYAPPTCAGLFNDVLCPSQFADWIEQLAAEQITGGCGSGNYCPGNPNTRGQMAVFLVKTFGLQLYGP